MPAKVPMMPEVVSCAVRLWVPPVPKRTPPEKVFEPASAGPKVKGTGSDANASDEEKEMVPA